jgi:hypothetical protein
MILYLFIHFPFPWWVKIGFAHTSAVKRAAALDKAVLGFFIPIGILVIPFAYTVEQYFHRLCHRLRFRFYRGDGSTETFWFPAALPVLAFMIFVWGCYFWAAGRMFGFDGLDWYRSFLLGMYLTFKQVYQFFA